MGNYSAKTMELSSDLQLAMNLACSKEAHWDSKLEQLKAVKMDKQKVATRAPGKVAQSAAAWAKQMELQKGNW